MNNCQLKLVTEQDALAACRELRSQVKRIGFVRFTAPFLGAEHVLALESARGACDALFVAVVAAAGDPSPPYGDLSIGERARILSGLSSVTFVVALDQTGAAEKFQQALHPDETFPVLEADYARMNFAPPFERRPAVFIDRDGTLLEPVEYLHEPARMKLFPDSGSAVRRLAEAGYRIVVVSNQPGIGLGYFTKEDFFSVNRAMMRALGECGARIDRFYFCPHSQSEKCTCRKPGTALIDRAVRELNIDVLRSYVIGDMTGDIKLGENAGCKTVLVRTGAKGEDGLFTVSPTFTVETLGEAAARIIAAA